MIVALVALMHPISSLCTFGSSAVRRLSGELSPDTFLLDCVWIHLIGRLDLAERFPPENIPAIHSLPVVVILHIQSVISTEIGKVDSVYRHTCVSLDVHTLAMAQSQDHVHDGSNEHYGDECYETWERVVELPAPRSHSFHRHNVH